MIYVSCYGIKCLEKFAQIICPDNFKRVEIAQEYKKDLQSLSYDSWGFE